MTDWDLLLTPLLVLPIVLLFRFVGCGLSLVGEAQPAPATPPADPAKPSLPDPSNPPIPKTPIDPPPKYPPYADYILGDPHVGDVKHPGVKPVKDDVIAYWRLIDPEPPTVAADAKGFQPGTYEKSYALPPTADSKGKAPPAFGPPDIAGLIVTDNAAKCRLFDGGHVKVPFKQGLYTDNFTIEAWIKADAFDAGFEYVLFDARGRYALPGMAVATRGFRVFVSQQQGWQVQLAPSNANLFQPAPIVSLPAPRTHVALTVGPPVGGEKPVNFYVDGKLVAGPVKVNTYNRPDGVDALLLIGVENIQDNPAQTPQYRHPVLCRIQEVVLHNKALSQEEIENHVFINQL